MKRPAFQFYPGDWLHDAALRLCSVGARGTWIDMLSIMHQGSEYGYLKVNGQAISPPSLARVIGATVEETQGWLNELEHVGVFSRTDDGVIYSRRMVKDEALREIRANGGKMGGNPALTSNYNRPGFVYAVVREEDGAVKIGISQNPSKRLYKIRAQYPGCSLTLIGERHVPDMGAAEAGLHARFAHCKSGEWFSLTPDEKEALLGVHLKDGDAGPENTEIPDEPDGNDPHGQPKRPAKAAKQKKPKPTFNFETRSFENIDPEMMETWAEAYPAISIESELSKVAAWLLSNPSRRKTEYPRFLNTWFSRAQDSGRGQSNSQGGVLNGSTGSTKASGSGRYVGAAERNARAVDLIFAAVGGHDDPSGQTVDGSAERVD